MLRKCSKIVDHAEAKPNNKKIVAGNIFYTALKFLGVRISSSTDDGVDFHI